MLKISNNISKMKTRGIIMNRQYVKGDCYFTHSCKVMPDYPCLKENIECDILIIGGGVTGAIAGYYFSKAGIDAVIVEKSRIAHGSTSITTALLQYELDDNAEQLTEYMKPEDIATAYKLGLFALEEIEEFIKLYENDFQYKRVDTLLYTQKNIEINEMHNEYEFRKNNGIDVEYIDGRNNNFGFDIKAGVLGKNGGAVIDPYRYAHSLIKASVKKGMRVYENTETLKINYCDGYIEAETEFGHKIKCKKVVCATGYNTSLFTDKRMGTKSTTFNIVTKPDMKINDSIKNTIFRDNNDPYHYFRATQDNRIIMGGEDIRFEPDFENNKLCEKSYENLRMLLRNLMPDIDVQPEYEYAGAFDSTNDNLGFIGEDTKHNDLWYCLGYGANGILFAILGGVFLSKLFRGETDKNMRLFAPDRFDR